MDYKTTTPTTVTPDMTREIMCRYQLEAMKINYKNMKTLHEINVAIERMKQELAEEYIPKDVEEHLIGGIEALKWVTNNSHTTKEDVTNLVSEMNKTYQMTIWDYITDNDDEIIE